MSSKETKRKRGRPPVIPRKSSSRLATSQERTEAEVRTSTRKRGRPANYYATEDASDAKRKRGHSPEVAEESGLEDAESEIDDAGERKINANGKLLGGREYKVSTFTLPSHGDQLLMLAMDPTKCLGYRDSYLFFHKNPSLKRVRITDEEKEMLVKMGLLVTWFKNREVAVVTARSVFKRFGSKIVKHGKRLKDDYFESKARQDGVVEEEEAEEGEAEEEVDVDEIDNSRQSLIGKTKRSEGYSSDAPLDNRTWLHHAALAARGFNAQLHERRSAKPAFYDIHSNINQIPAALQSTHCTFEFDTKKDASEPTEIEFKPSQWKGPPFRGHGKDLLDYDIQSALDTLPEDIRQEAESIIVDKSLVKKVVEDDKYPLSLMEGQYQAAYSVHQVRFNYPVPKIPEPTVLLDTAQSLAAQQHYLGLVYQSVNQFADPQRQNAVRGPMPTYSQQPSLPPPPPPPQMQPMQTMQPMQPMRPHIPPPMKHSPEPALCGFILPNNQPCRRTVGRPGEKCQLHAPIFAATTAGRAVSLADAAKGPPPNVTYSNNKCADCHQLRANDSLFSAGEERVTDDFVLVKCSNCTRKYHPICANLTTPRQVAAVESYPWQCPECKICCVCKSAGDESTLMICDGCDRGWHTGCCNPKVDNVPEGEWLCALCAQCHNCDEKGMATECQYHHATAPKSDAYKYPVYLATYCHKCNEHFTDDRFCTVCLKTYSEEEGNDDDEMVACDSCDHWVHTKCDQTLTPEKYQLLCDEEDAKYSCPMCEDRVERLVNTSAAELALKGLSAPSGICVGLLGGKVKTRGVVKYKNIKVGVPEINGAGISEMPAA